MAENLIFYHICTEKTLTPIDLSLWTDPKIQLKIVADDLPTQIVYQQAPHIHWMTKEEFQQMKQNMGHEKIFLGLPSLYHVPLFGDENLTIPQGFGVMVPVFDFDWVYYTKSDEQHGGNNNNIIRYSQYQIRVDNKMPHPEKWVLQNLRPSWDMLYTNRDNLDMYQRRILLGLSKVLGEWHLVAELSPQCDWNHGIVQYDQAESAFHTTMRLPLQERRKQQFQTLQTCGYWYETWWALATSADKGFDDESVDVSIVHTRLKWKAVQNYHHPLQRDFPEWCEDMPIFRWIPKTMVEEDTLFRVEMSLLKTQHADEWMTPFWNRYLFGRVLSLPNPTSHHAFIQDSLPLLPRLSKAVSCEQGDLLFDNHDADFVPSSSALMVYPENPRWYVVNIRKVNYRIMPNGSYITMKQGVVSPTYNGISKNEFYLMDRETLRPLTPVRPMKEDEIPGHREEEIAIVGLEDVRLVSGINHDILFYGVTKSYSYSDAIRIMVGTYDIERCVFHSTKVIHPPYEENACEKNWAWCGNNRFIYKWHPVEIGSVDTNDRLVIGERLASPPYFKEFRGSSPAVQWKSYHWFSVHSVGYGQHGRKYLHSIVVLDLHSPEHKVVAVSSPFCFEDVQIEYTIGLDIYKGKIVFLYSTQDKTSKYLRLPLCHIVDKLLFFHQEDEMAFKTKLWDDFF